MADGGLGLAQNVLDIVQGVDYLFGMDKHLKRLAIDRGRREGVFDTLLDVAASLAPKYGSAALAVLAMCEESKIFKKTKGQLSSVQKGVRRPGGQR